jgi:hypothetical protein
MTKRLKQIIERVETWPEEAQDEVAELLLALEEERANPLSLTKEDIEAIERGLEDVRLGRFASDEAVREMFDRYHR